MSADSWWDNKVLPAIIAGVVTGVILYYTLPGAIAWVIGHQGLTPVSPVYPMNQETPTYYPCIACEKEVVPIW